MPHNQEAPRLQTSFCPSCGKAVRPGVPFCTVCGQGLALNAPILELPVPVVAVVESPKCSACGKQLREGAKFCNGCGMNILFGASMQEQAAQPVLPIEPLPEQPEVKTDEERIVAPAPVFAELPPTAHASEIVVPVLEEAPLIASDPASGNLCPACGAQARPGVRFCPQCGELLNESVAQQAFVPAPELASVPVVPEAKLMHNKKKLAAILIPIGALLLGCVICAILLIVGKPVFGFQLNRPSDVPLGTEPIIEAAVQFDVQPEDTTAYLESSVSNRMEYRVATGGDPLNMRERPGGDYDVLLKIPNGETVIDLGKEENGWALVGYNGNVGWVSMDYLTPSNVAQATTQKATAAQALTTIPDAVYVPTTTQALAQNADTLFQTGVRQIEAGSYNEAVNTYNEYLSLVPTDPIAHNNRGVAYLCLGFFPEAIEDFSYAIDRLGDRPWCQGNVYGNRGVAYLEAGNPYYGDLARVFAASMADAEPDSRITIDNPYSDDSRSELVIFRY